MNVANNVEFHLRMFNPPNHCALGDIDLKQNFLVIVLVIYLLCHISGN